MLPAVVMTPSTRTPRNATVYTSVPTQVETCSSTSASTPTITIITATPASSPDNTSKAESVTTFATSVFTTRSGIGGGSGSTSSTHTGNTPGKGIDSAAKVALGVGIPLGIAAIGLLLAGAYFWGKRASRAPKTTETAETHELLPDSMRHELPTGSNVTEMPSLSGSREVAVRSPVELPVDGYYR